MSGTFDDLDFDTEEDVETEVEEQDAPAEKQAYVPPAEQAELDNLFESFTVKCFKKGERPFASIHQNIGYATYEANKQHKEGGYYTKIYGNVELRWKGRERGYGIPDPE
jgi:hypothetical protein